LADVRNRKKESQSALNRIRRQGESDAESVPVFAHAGTADNQWVALAEPIPQDGHIVLRRLARDAIEEIARIGNPDEAMPPEDIVDDGLCGRATAAFTAKLGSQVLGIVIAEEALQPLRKLIRPHFIEASHLVEIFAARSKDG